MDPSYPASGQNKDGDLIVLIPSFRPGPVLALLVKTLAEHGLSVLIVDDGSGPDFTAVFEECRTSATVLSYPKNRGKGHALKVGFRFVLNDLPAASYVITADGDGQHRIIDILRMAERIKKRQRTIIGDRTFDVRVPLRSKIGNDLSKFAQSLFTYRYLHDDQCGLRAFPVDLLSKLVKLPGRRYEYEMNVISYLQLKEIRFETLKVQAIYEEGNKSSHFRPLYDTFRIQAMLFLASLPHLLAYGLFILLSHVFDAFVYQGMNIHYELAVITGFGIALFFLIVLDLLLFRPRHPIRSIVRLILYELLVFLSVLIAVIIFGRVLDLPIALSSFIGLLAAVFPLYALIKGLGIIFGSPR